MSTSIQLKGDSLRRQLQLSESYALANGLELIDSLDGILLNDIGISAFKSDNSKTGTLGLFISALQAGKIPENSVLLVESLDRLSRDKITGALRQFMHILELGIEIVTMNDNQTYTLASINGEPTKLFLTIISMIRANEESETKSKRLLAAWSNKRAHASTKILTKICPAWLKFDDKLNNFVVIDSKVKTIMLIFDMCINTSGLYAIAKYLNSNQIPVFGKGKLWYRSYVKKIINSRAVLGEYLPTTTGKDQCNLVEFYYPQIIDHEVFMLAQLAIDRRTKNNKGRKGVNFSNIFSGLIYCGHCGFKMVLKNRGDTS